ncbi:MAG: response regulator transcription factor [Proteobacteria bacterium]|nr:response regulator transcription factor [Pseudomonadota bacterium]
MTARTILVIEDNPEIAGLLSLHLRDIGCRVQSEQDGLRGLSRAQSDRPDLIVLDLMLPGLDGMEICRRLRGGANCTPILMLTARSTEEDRVAGLDMGADDYLTKPFSIPEFLARVKAIFRRQERIVLQTNTAQLPIRAGALHIDLERRGVNLDGNEIELTATEFDLLVQFASNPGRVYTRPQLLDLVWGHNNASYEHTVNSHINRLRAKIEQDPAKPDYVMTVWGVGYKFSDRFSG